MDRMTYSNFGYYKPQDSDLDHAEKWAFPFIEGSQFRAINVGIDEPACQINCEDWLPGPDIWWSMNHDEVHVVTKGRAEVEYWLAPLMQENKMVIAEVGDVYYLPRGARIRWRVLGDEPFRHLCICYPNPGYPVPKAKSVGGGMTDPPKTT